MKHRTQSNRYGLVIAAFLMVIAFACKPSQNTPLKLWYDHPAEEWTEALPVGNGRMGAMIFGGVEKEHIQFNEETLWTGEPHDYAHPGASRYLDEIRRLLSEGRQEEAERLATEEFMSVPVRQKDYQPFGDLYLEFPAHDTYDNYRRELDISNAICRTSYESGGIKYTREVIASQPRQVIAMHLRTETKGTLAFRVKLDAAHEAHSINILENGLELSVRVKNGSLSGIARVKVETDGTMIAEGNAIHVKGATDATLWLGASTNFVNYHDVGKDPVTELDSLFRNLEGLSYDQVRKAHISDYRSLFDRFGIELGNNLRDSLPTDERIMLFNRDPEDPQLLALYTQYGRYLLISSSRPGTQPANLQGIWNRDLAPAWGSKYTININTEMNYWPAEVTNLSECAEPLFQMIGECAETGSRVAREHYNCDGWVAHHNTDLWRGTAPINYSNHGIWVSGSGWLVHHLWEHYLFTRDETFLREKAYPLMRSAALFYSQYLVEDPETGWLISTPSNSPENGGLVAGPTMDHQIIRSLFNACVEASSILGTDGSFASELKGLSLRIAPNQVGRYGQLQEWMDDVDDPENRHRHVSHLWGIHPGNDINWDTGPGLMEAARQSLLFRGDDGTGWSLAWKINFWARLLEGDHAYEMVKMIFRPVFSDELRMGPGGGSYPNLFDAHPPFQIDGNFGAAAGMVEMLVQSHRTAIDILPALPSVLPEGTISGVCARGGFELSFSWTDGKLSRLEVLSKAGETCRLRYRERKIEFETSIGQTYGFDGELKAL